MTAVFIKLVILAGPYAEFKNSNDAAAPRSR